MTANLSFFFIVGSSRSGTTLLASMLGAHPDIAVTQETHFGPQFWNHRRDFGDLSDDRNWETLVDRFAQTEAFTDMAIDRDAFRARARSIPHRYGPLLELLLKDFAERQRVRIVGEKTPLHALILPTLDSWFPDARYIEIVRDPRAVVASMNKLPWSKGSAANNAEVWRRRVAAVRKDSPRLGRRFIQVRYERLVADPEGELRRLAEFLGAPYNPQMLEYRDRQRWSLDEKREPWRADAADEITQEPVDRWRTELSADDVRDVEAVAYFEMRRLGFHAESRGPRLVGQASLAASRRRGIAALALLRQLGLALINPAQSVRRLRERLRPGVPNR